MVFAAGFIAGMQFPAFVDQYAKRVNAHYLESKLNFKGFQLIADQFFGGDVYALIAKHESSDDKVFFREGAVIRKNYERMLYLERHDMELKKGVIAGIKEFLFYADKQIFSEIYYGFSPVLALNLISVFSGIVSGFILWILFYVLFKITAPDYVK